jgi:phage replication-related protein YjqB (UPF0714/DUF867 family)
MADKYHSFSALAAAEEATAFNIYARDLATRVAVAAPHGGEIEAGTSEVARAIAGNDLSLYLFEGTKEARNSDLHITSTRFDEPVGIQLLTRATTVLTVHGAAGSEEVTYVGGRDERVSKAIVYELEQSGFKAERHSDPMLQGLHPGNICNVGRSEAGAQLEISRGLRRLFFESLTREGRRAPTDSLSVFSAAIRAAIGQ